MLDAYLDYRLAIQRTCIEQVSKDRRFLIKIQQELGKSVLEAQAASDLNKAIFSAAEKRKMAYNGGQQDDGENMRFRLGQALVGYFRWAHAEGLVQRNIYSKNPFRRPPRRDANFHGAERLKVIRARLEGLPIRDQALISFLIDTGMRVSEVRRVEIEHINFETGCVWSYMTKVKREKEPAISDNTKVLLKKYLAGRKKRGQFLFPNPSGRMITGSSIRQRFAVLSKQVFGFRANPHSFRHTMCTMWKREGASDSEIMAQAGLVDVKMLAHYTHLAGKDLRRAQDRVYAKAKLINT